MRITCAQCKKTFYKDDLHKVVFSDDGIYFFCSKMCMDNWNYVIVPSNVSSETEQPSV
jgi:ribosomal protein L24E